MAALRTADRAWGAVLRGMMAVATLYLAAIFVAILYTIAWRSLGWSYTAYNVPFIEYGFVYILFLGAPWLVRERGHVYVELLIMMLPDRGKAAASRTIALVCAVTCFTWAVYTGRLFWFYWNDPMSFDPLRAGLDLKLWMGSLPAPVGFAAMGVEFALMTFGSRLLHAPSPG